MLECIAFYSGETLNESGVEGKLAEQFLLFCKDKVPEVKTWRNNAAYQCKVLLFRLFERGAEPASGRNTLLEGLALIGRGAEGEA